ncbi:S9 family peptidase [Reyranella sp. CPCC 100927]|uniref:alpha/beta hydrolase family protein n=1 Tax=Reyranella sp. CPCC 100927 TaxID=2599616 RepID=UPI0011B434BB|nr:alpha/beta hydrolase [Reyranella sp. CPCC 100927]TWT06133.1 alpha/beta fold hydrolase [Reyranella sp. CPCC 100927]
MARVWMGVVSALIIMVPGSVGAQPTPWPWSQPAVGPALSQSKVMAELPPDIAPPVAAPDAPPALVALLGTWTGWMCPGATCSTRLAIESVTATGAKLVFAVARDGAPGTWSRLDAAWQDGELAGILRDGGRINLRPRADGYLDVLWRGESGTLPDSGLVYRDDGPVGRALARRENALVPLRIAGEPYRLELTTYRPSRPGRLPLVVFNHGSTGGVPAMTKVTFDSLSIAAFLVERGWAVAFPMRRGRGRSDGAYEEHYSCDPGALSSGLERALTDLDAIVDHVRGLDWVDPERIVIGGTSRGGILSLAYAARRPERTKAVLNFVGGWTSEFSGCHDFNRSVMAEAGARYKGPTLWIYGEDDRFYSIAHSRANFDAFRGAGGNGRFLVLQSLAPSRGHYLFPHLGWRAAADALLGEITAPR